MLYLPLSILAMTPGEDRLFLEGLYTQYGDLMYRVALHLLRAHPEAEDVVSDACLKLIEKIERLRTLDEDTLRAYIVTTVRNTAFNRLSRRARERGVSFLDGGEAISGVAGPDDVEDAVILRADQVQLRQALAKLSQRDRWVLEMRYLADQDDRQMARALGIAPDSVRSCLHRARQRLRAILGKGG